MGSSELDAVLAIPEKPEELVISETSLIAVPTETIPAGVTLPCSIYIKVANKYTLFRQQGEKLTTQRALDLKRKGAEALYIHEGFWQIFLKHLEAIELPKPVTPQTTALHLRHLIIAYGQEVERQSKESRKNAVLRLVELAGSLSQSLADDRQMGPTILRKSGDPRLYFMNHLVNATLYANLIGRKMNLSTKDIGELTTGVILHDIGTLFLSKRILYKRGDLTTEELGILRTHPRQGAEYLQSMNMPNSVVTTALHHHEKFDGSGYPDQLRGEKIPLFARLCAIADVYDAITSNRPYKEGLTPKEALNEMSKMEGHFDPRLLRIVAANE